MEEVGFSLEPDAAAEQLRDVLPHLWPALVAAPAEPRAGLRPASPDGLPLCGPVPGVTAAYAFTAHFRNGFLLCPHGARMAAKEILEGKPQDLLGPLRPGRFEAARA